MNKKKYFIKNREKYGRAYFTVGFGSFVIAFFTMEKIHPLLKGFLYGFGGVLFIIGIIFIFSDFYWKKTKSEEEYRSMIEEEEIDCNDELKTMLKYKAGSITNTISTVITCLAIVSFILLENFNIRTDIIWVILYLSAYLLFKSLFPTVYYSHLLKKYSE